MKKFLLLSVVAIFISSLSFAKIWRVNNRPGITAHFTSAQQAHDSAAVQNGDTLYFEHSTTTYGALVMSKRLVLMGAGAFLNYTPNLQYNLQAPALGIISLRPSAAGSVISVNANYVNDTANNVTITRCWIYNDIILYNADDCSISHTATNVISCSNSIGEGCYNIVVHNNIIVAGIIGVVFSSSTNNGCYLASNFICYNNSIGVSVQAAGAFYNNIMAQIITDGSSPVNNNIFQNPMSFSNRKTSGINQCGNISTSFAAGNGNVFSIPASSIWASGGLNIQNDRTITFAAGSPAIGAGTGGTDCGATGGPTPYVFGAQPAIPAIYKLNVAVPTTGNSIGVTISTRSNN